MVVKGKQGKSRLFIVGQKRRMVPVLKDGDEISRKVHTASGMKAFELLPWLNCSLGGRSW